ncbi:ECF transporter S component [Clostridium polynesiense]|uniref:ECF transporter S component n=1 Tax=Clostridium polynesiense TaxID=1325933 RepID=UPI00058DBBDD|nr:ECF transporter S component [Clostridium polynesiense]
MKENNTKKIVLSAFFLTIALIAQSLGRIFPNISQIFVGSVVNGVLILAAYICGLYYAIIVSALTPLLAFLTGQLNPLLGPFLPFIAIGNIILTAFFHYFSRKGQWGMYMGILGGSLLKFSFLFFSAAKLVFFLALPIPAKAAQNLTVAMGSIQLVTAIIGGSLALFIIKALKIRKII